MTQPDPMTMTSMASYAQHRAGLWRAVGELVGPVTDRLLDRATDGRLARELEVATHWVGETNPFADVLPSRRDVFEHGRATDADGERAALRRELEEHYDETLAPEFERGAKACGDEADAWELGEPERAKEARLEQHRWLQGELEGLSEWCVRLYRDAESEPGQMVARIVAAHLALESGVNVPSRLKRY